MWKLWGTLNRERYFWHSREAHAQSNDNSSFLANNNHIWCFDKSLMWNCERPWGRAALKCLGVIVGCCLCKITQQCHCFFLKKKKKKVYREAEVFKVGTLLSAQKCGMCSGCACALCLKAFETCICAVPMLGKHLSAVYLITGGMHRMGSFLWIAIIYKGLPGNAYHIFTWMVHV